MHPSCCLNRHKVLPIAPTVDLEIANIIHSTSVGLELDCASHGGNAPSEIGDLVEVVDEDHLYRT